MVKFKTIIEKAGKLGEKTGWTYVIFPATVARKLSPSKVSFRIKGKLDAHPIKGVAILPMGKGTFMLPINADLRKATGKKNGDKLTLEIELDTKKPVVTSDLIKCLETEPDSLIFFKSLPKSHQLYFSKWIESAKTIATKTKRITMAVIAMSKRHGYPEMMRAAKKNDEL
jgi:Domain of unknown function (DUF1905)/Bacteriocin-protection, YdeI or OmpD-Associated